MADQHVTRRDALHDLQQRIGVAIARLTTGAACDVVRDRVVMDCRQAALGIVLVEPEPPVEPVRCRFLTTGHHEPGCLHYKPRA